MDEPFFLLAFQLEGRQIALGENSYPGRAIGLGGKQLFQNPDPTKTFDLKIVSTVVQSLIRHDAGEASDRANRRSALVVGFPAGGEENERDQPIAGNGIRSHLPIARLKNVQSLGGVRKHHRGLAAERAAPCRQSFAEAAFRYLASMLSVPCYRR